MRRSLAHMRSNMHVATYAQGTVMTWVDHHVSQMGYKPGTAYCAQTMQRVYGAVDGDVSSWRPAPLKEHGSPRYLWTDAFGKATYTWQYLLLFANPSFPRTDPRR